MWLLGLQRSSLAARQLLLRRHLVLCESCGRGRGGSLTARRLLHHGLLMSGTDGLRVQPSPAAGWWLPVTCLLLSGSCGRGMCIFLWGEIQEDLVHNPKSQLLDGCHLCWGKRGQEQLLMVGLQGLGAQSGPSIQEI